MEADCSGETCPVPVGYLVYTPSLAGSAFMLAAFAVLAPLQILGAVRYKTPLFSLTMVCGLLLEVMGYVGKLLLRISPARRNYFLIYSLGTLTGPAFVAAAIYLVLPHLFIGYGQEIPLLSQPMYLSVVFLVFDVATLALQAVGCAFVAMGSTGHEVQLSTTFLLAGLAFLAAGLLAFLGLRWTLSTTDSVSSMRRTYRRGRAAISLSPRFKIFLVYLDGAAAFIVIRTIVGIVEYSMGLNSFLARSEIISLTLDATPVLLACALLTVLPPGAAFGDAWSETSPYGSSARSTRYGEDLPLRHDRRGSDVPNSPRVQMALDNRGMPPGGLVAEQTPSPEATYSPSTRRPPWEAGPYGTVPVKTVALPAGGSPSYYPPPPAESGPVTTQYATAPNRMSRGLPATPAPPNRPQRPPRPPRTSLIQFTHQPPLAPARTASTTSRNQMVQPDSLW